MGKRFASDLEAYKKLEKQIESIRRTAGNYYDNFTYEREQKNKISAICSEKIEELQTQFEKVETMSFSKRLSFLFEGASFLKKL